jgi:hypothetical protein
MNIKSYFLVVLFITLCFSKTFAETTSDNKNSLFDNTSISGQWFLNNSYDDLNKIDKFSLKRGYFTIKSKLNDMFSVRYTQDITIDTEGGDAGNVEMRLKYLYLKMKLKDIKLLEDTYFEIGLVHRPWLDYEEHINRYRVQGTMFVERYHLFNSADFGITYVGLLGGELDEDYQKNISSSYPGRYGSFAFGVYNGAGYHAIEFNNNKTIEGRLSLRPIPDWHPGLQLSYSFITGMANTPDNKTDFNSNLFMLSSESRHLVATAQYYLGSGDFHGRYSDANGKALQNDGYSVFCEFKIPSTPLALFGRYDDFKSLDTDINDQNTVIAGIAYRFLKSKVIFDFNYFEENDKIVRTYEIAVEVIF